MPKEIKIDKKETIKHKIGDEFLLAMDERQFNEHYYQEKFEIILAEVIGDLYVKYKEGFCDYENKTHKLGFFKEQIKAEVHNKLNKLYDWRKEIL